MCVSGGDLNDLSREICPAICSVNLLGESAGLESRDAKKTEASEKTKNKTLHIIKSQVLNKESYTHYVQANI